MLPLGLQKWQVSFLRMATGVVPTTTSPIPKSVWRNSLGKNNAMQQSKKYLSMCLYTFCWQCEGFIYVALDSSRCGWYYGVNAFLGNASYLVMGL